jgi:MYXO-CTERM domain-containing protein
LSPYQPIEWREQLGLAGKDPLPENVEQVTAMVTSGCSCAAAGTGDGGARLAGWLAGALLALAQLRNRVRARS